MIDRYFKLAENQTSVKEEMLGGLTTFVTMAYIIVVNPQILAQAGMAPKGVAGRSTLPRQFELLTRPSANRNRRQSEIRS